MNAIWKRQKTIHARRMLLIGLVAGLLFLLVVALITQISRTPFLPGNRLPPGITAEDFYYRNQSCTAFRQESRVVGVECW